MATYDAHVGIHMLQHLLSRIKKIKHYVKLREHMFEI